MIHSPAGVLRMDTTRREFLTLLAAIGGGIGLLGSACGDDDAPVGPGADGGGGGCAATQSLIAANHGHTLVVDRSHVTAGIERTYDITGSAEHGHTVTLTVAHFATLAGGGSVMVTSTLTGHTHVVTVSCL